MRSRQTLELRQLRNFVTLADEMNFRRAAARLFIAQPSLSHQIAQLEANLGTRLFRRDRRGVSLTPAGKEILEDARRLLGESEAIVHKAQQIAATDSATLHVGYPEFANRTIIPEILLAFRGRHPDVKLQLSEGYGRKLVPELRSGGLDVAFIILPAADDLGSLQVEMVINEKVGILLAANHRLAELGDIPIEAIAEEQLLLAARSANPALNDYVLDWFHRSGLEPRFSKVGSTGGYTYGTMLRVIESGEGISLSPASLLKPLPPGTVFRPIRGSAPHFQMGAVWSDANPSVAVRQLLEMAKTMRAESAAT